MALILKTTTFGCIPIDQNHDNVDARSHLQQWQIFPISDRATLVKEQGSSIVILPTIKLHRTIERMIVPTTEQVAKQEAQFTRELMIEQQSVSVDGPGYVKMRAQVQGKQNLRQKV